MSGFLIINKFNPLIMTPEEILAAETAKGAEAANKGKNKAKNDQPTASEMEAAQGKTAEYFEEQGKKSKENKAQGGKEVEVSLTNKTFVRFTKNHGFFKKGHEQEVSDVAFAIYDKAGVIEKL